MVVQYVQGSIYDVKLGGGGGGSFPPADRTLTYPIEYYVSRNTVKSANVWDIAMLLNFLNQGWGWLTDFRARLFWFPLGWLTG